MRRLSMLPLALGTCALLFISACDAVSDEDDGGDVMEPDVMVDVPVGAACGDGTCDADENWTNCASDCSAEYFSVLIEDSWDGVCRSTNGADGADIDAVTLVSDGFDDVYLAAVNASLGVDDCTNEHTDLEEVKGAPDGTLTTNFASLQGGWLAGEFDDEVAIVEGDTLLVHETGTEVGGIDEAYQVSVAYDMTCPDTGDLGSCATLLSDVAEGQSSIDVPASAF